MAVSITELLDVIKKTGLPIGEKLTKTQQDIDNENVIRSGVQGLYDPSLNQLDADKKAKIETLAGVDGKFSQLFGQGGKYQLRNPMDVERLTSGGQDIALSDFMRTAQSKNDLLKEFEKDVASATSLYGQIDPNKGEGSGLGDLQYIHDTYGIDLPGIDVEDSEWEITNTGDLEWEVVGDKKLPGADIIDKPQNKNYKWPNVGDFLPK